MGIRRQISGINGVKGEPFNPSFMVLTQAEVQT